MLGLVTCLLFVVSVLASSDLEVNQLVVSLYAQWPKVPFRLSLIESISTINEELYDEAVLKVLGIPDDSTGGEYMDLGHDDISYSSDERTYMRVVEGLKLDEYEKSFLNISLANHIYSPRIVATYEYYDNMLKENSLSKELYRACARDSFGSILLEDEGDRLDAWVSYGRHIYCSFEDLFAIKTNSRSIEVKLLPFDRIIGHNEGSPLLILYGDIESKRFRDMFFYLYKNAQEGKLRFVWRYIPSGNVADKESLGGFGVDLSLKDLQYTYKTTGDQKSKFEERKVLDIGQYCDTIEQIEEQNIEDLGLKLSAYVLADEVQDESRFDLLSKTLNDLPRHLSQISQLKPKNMNNVNETLKKNERLGSSKDALGFYLNGSPINPLELDTFKLIEKLRDELNMVKDLIHLGFSVKEAKTLIYKFALLSAVKDVHFRSGHSDLGTNENRYRLYTHEFLSASRGGAVVFFNDISKDDAYNDLPESALDGYLTYGSRMAPFQIPPYRKNVHDLIFVLNLGNKEQLRVFFYFAKGILDQSIPQQIGIIPLNGENPYDRILAQKFYFLTEVASKQEALALLYKYLDSKNDIEADEVLNLVKVDDNYELDQKLYQSVLDMFSITAPSVIMNGVFYDLTSPNWQRSLKQQIIQDIARIKFHLDSDRDTLIPVKDILYDNAKNSRNLRLIPKEPKEMKFVSITRELLSCSYEFKFKNDNLNLPEGTLWLVGDLSSDTMLSQLGVFLNFIRSSEFNLKLRLLDLTGSISWSKFKRELASTQFDLSNSTDLSKLLKRSSADKKDSNEHILNILAKSGVPSSQPFMLFNSRYIELSTPLSQDELATLTDFEINQRLALIDEIINSYPSIFDSKTKFDFNSNDLDDSDFLDLLSSRLIKSFHVDNKDFLKDVSRYDFFSLDRNNSLIVSEAKGEGEVDVLLIIDPLSEISQKMVSMLSLLKDLPFVNCEIILQPSIHESQIKLRRFYRGLYSSRVAFDKSGSAVYDTLESFQNIPKLEKFNLNADLPRRWVASPEEVPDFVDLDNIKFADYNETSIKAAFSLRSLLIDGQVKDSESRFNGGGSFIQASKFNAKVESFVLSNLGYFQLSVSPGIWSLELKEGKSKRFLSLLSVTSGVSSFNEVPHEREDISVLDLSGVDILIRVRQNAGYDMSKFLLAKNEEVPPKNGIFSFGKKNSVNKPHAEINIFTIASGHLYERLASIMVASVRSHTDKSVKIWIVGDFLSPRFKRFIPSLESKYNVEIELISYKWPNWLRSQREKHRTIWGYKMLFLDVLFPPDLTRVIFVDADQVARTDLKELNEIDLKDAPYGFVPMCDSKKDVEGFRFWKRGYWEEVLKDKYKYHISALFLVDLTKFREISAGNRLRAHYQKLSFDPASLSNLDQDLPNNMQGSIKIFSLPQEWLWCDTWCSKETLRDAKMIDLCNDPLSKESKIERAQRIIPEWSEYNEEIALLEEYHKHEGVQSSLNVAKEFTVSSTLPAGKQNQEPYDYDEL